MNDCDAFPYNRTRINKRCKLTYVLSGELTINEMYHTRPYREVIAAARDTHLASARDCTLIDDAEFRRIQPLLDVLHGVLGDVTLRFLLEKNTTDWPSGVEDASWALACDILLPHNHVLDGGSASRPHEYKNDIQDFFNENFINSLGRIGHRKLNFFITTRYFDIPKDEIAIWHLGKRFGVFDQNFYGRQHRNPDMTCADDKSTAPIGEQLVGQAGAGAFSSVNNKCWLNVSGTYSCHDRLGSNCTIESGGEPSGDDTPCV